MKLPKPFRKPIKAKKFEKKILKRIYIDKEREFLLSIVKKDDAGRYVISRELTKPEAKRLKALAKSIKKNKGVVTVWKAGIIGVIIAAVLIFNILFKDQLAERGIEAALESVFLAESELTGTKVSLIRGEIRFDSLQVADRGEPMRNLFQLAETELDLNTWELLRKRVVIERAVCTGIALGTDREVSGVLPGREAEGAADSGVETEESSGLENLVSDADPEALLAAQMERLESLPYIEEVNAEYAAAVEKWPDTIAALEDDLRAAEAAADEIRAIRFDRIDTLDEAAAAAKVIEENSPAIERAAARVEDAAEDFDRDRRRLTELQQGVQDAIEADYALLESVVADPGGELTGIASQAADNILRAKLKENYRKLNRLVAAGKKLTADTAGGEATPDKRRAGETVYFPATGYPRFLMQEFIVSAGSLGEDPFVELSISDLNSDPDLWGRPSRISFSMLNDGLGVDGDGELDLRSDAEHLLTFGGELAGGGFDLGSALDHLGIEDFEGGAGGSLEFRLNPDEEGEGQAQIILSPLRPSFDGADDLLKEAIREILGNTDSTRIELSFMSDGALITDLDVRSDLDSQLSAQVGAYLEQKADELTEELKERLRDELADELQRNSELQNLLGESGGEMAGALRDGASAEEILDSRRNEVEERIEEIKDEAAGQVEDEAKNLLEDAAKELKLPF